jgi:hypothetical protein
MEGPLAILVGVAKAAAMVAVGALAAHLLTRAAVALAEVPPSRTRRLATGLVAGASTWLLALVILAALLDALALEREVTALVAAVALAPAALVTRLVYRAG